MLNSSLYGLRSCSCGVCRNCKRAKRLSFKNNYDSLLDNFYDSFSNLDSSPYELFQDENDLFLEEYFSSEPEDIEDLFAGQKSGYSSDHFAARLVAVISRMRPSFLSGEISFSVHVRDGSKKLAVKAVGSKTDGYKCSKKKRYVGAINPDIVYRFPSKKLVNLEVDDRLGSRESHQECHLVAMQGAYDSARIIEKFTKYKGSDKDGLLRDLKLEKNTLSKLVKNNKIMNKNIIQISKTYDKLFKIFFENDLPENSYNYKFYKQYNGAAWKRKVFGVIVNSVKQKNYLTAFKKFSNTSEPPKTMSKFILITNSTINLPKIKEVKDVTYSVNEDGRILSKEKKHKKSVSIKDLDSIKDILDSET